jgi:hypothetical protein
MKTRKCVCNEDVLLDEDIFIFLKDTRIFCSYGRIFVWRNKKKYALARIILNAPSGLEAEHKDRNIHNNLRENLRLATPQQNTCNRKMSTNTTGYKGISKSGHKWRARIVHKGKGLCLGAYDTKEQAAQAYNDAALKLNGEFAYLNIL